MMDCNSTNSQTKEALGKILLQHPEPLRFTQGRWIQGDTLSISYLMYKSTVALALLVIEIVILIYYPKENKSKFFIYPQHWGFALITLAFFLDASLVISRYIVQKTKKPVDLRWRNKIEYQDGIEMKKPFNYILHISMALTATAYPWVFCITLIYCTYWPSTATVDNSKSFDGSWDSYHSIIEHLLATVIALMDTFISSRPWNLRQAWCPIFMGLIYTCFNATYILAFEGTDIYGNPYIYSFLNWKKDPLKSAMISLGNILVLFVLFLAYYFLAKFRDFFWARYVYDDAFDNQKARKISRV